MSSACGWSGSPTSRATVSNAVLRPGTARVVSTDNASSRSSKSGAVPLGPDAETTRSARSHDRNALASAPSSRSSRSARPADPTAARCWGPTSPRRGSPREAQRMPSLHRSRASAEEASAVRACSTPSTNLWTNRSPGSDRPAPESLQSRACSRSCAVLAWASSGVRDPTVVSTKRNPIHHPRRRGPRRRASSERGSGWLGVTKIMASFASRTCRSPPPPPAMPGAPPSADGASRPGGAYRRRAGWSPNLLWTWGP